jgi:CPA2 family monovalent cation:H+ antiporter-2
LVYGIITVFISIIYLTYVSPLITGRIPGLWGKLLSLVIILVIISPFLRAIMMKKNHSREFIELWAGKRVNRSSLLALIVVRVMLCVGWVMFVISHIFTLTTGFLFGIAMAVVFIYISSRFIKMQSIRLERHFLRNLTLREAEADKQAPVKQGLVRSLLARDLHLADFEVSPGSPSVGKKLMELDLRRRNGVNIVKIVRGDRYINIPGGNEYLYPYDKIVVAGTDKQIADFRRFIDERKRTQQQSVEDRKDVALENFVVEPHSPLVGKSLRQSHIRDHGACLVIAVERDGQSLLNPDADLTLAGGDLVWVVGEHAKLEALLRG